MSVDTGVKDNFWVVINLEHTIHYEGSGIINREKIDEIELGPFTSEQSMRQAIEAVVPKAVGADADVDVEADEMIDHSDCKYLGNDAWNCGHIDNSDECDCHVCSPRMSVGVVSEKPLNYVERVTVVAGKYKIDRAAFKALIEDAFGRSDSPPASKEAIIALRKLRRLKVTAADLNWMFGYTVIGGHLG